MAKRDDIYFGADAANPSGAPEAGGATTSGSQFGGETFVAGLLRLVARIARDVEATAYRRLRDLDVRQHNTHRPGAPRRVKEAFSHRPHPTA